MVLLRVGLQEGVEAAVAAEGVDAAGEVGVEEGEAVVGAVAVK